MKKNLILILLLSPLMALPVLSKSLPLMSESNLNKLRELKIHKGKEFLVSLHQSISDDIEALRLYSDWTAGLPAENNPLKIKMLEATAMNELKTLEQIYLGQLSSTNKNYCKKYYERNVLLIQSVLDQNIYRLKKDRSLEMYLLESYLSLSLQSLAMGSEGSVSLGDTKFTASCMDSQNRKAAMNRLSAILPALSAILFEEEGILPTNKLTKRSQMLSKRIDEKNRFGRAYSLYVGSLVLHGAIYFTGLELLGWMIKGAMALPQVINLCNSASISVKVVQNLAPRLIQVGINTGMGAKAGIDFAIELSKDENTQELQNLINNTGEKLSEILLRPELDDDTRLDLLWLKENSDFKIAKKHRSTVVKLCGGNCSNDIRESLINKSNRQLREIFSILNEN